MTNRVLPGIYPMLYSFFDEAGRLRLDPFRLQVDAAIANHATGIAILGLGTEVSKLTVDERLQVLEVVTSQLENRAPLLVTVYGDTAEKQLEFASLAIEKGATALLLQPPSKKLSDNELFDFFSRIIGSVDCPVGIQNAPEFLGFGLSNASLIELARSHGHFKIAKLECAAVALQPIVSALPDSVLVLNGRCGLELPDNLRAGAKGVIPSLETVDKTSEIYAAFTSGDHQRADQIYTQVLPVTAFVMQGIPQYLTYGKLLAALRLGIEAGGNRDPLLRPTEFGIACAQRFADSLGRLGA